MLINLTDVFTSEGKVRKENPSYEPEIISYMGSEYRIIDKSPIELSFSNTGAGKILMQGSMKLSLQMVCDRCLKPVEQTLDIRIENELLSPEAISRVEDEDVDKQDYLTGYELDTQELMNSEILINMPIKVLCKSDCKGICKQCGHNLNEGSCGCDTFVPDPRMAAIKDIFNANKEV